MSDRVADSEEVRMHISFSKHCKVCGKNLTGHWDGFYNDSIHVLRRDCCSPLDEEEQEIHDAEAVAFDLRPNLEEREEPSQEFLKAYSHYMELYDTYIKKYKPLMNFSG
jgi:hypothetical protein